VLGLLPALQQPAYAQTGGPYGLTWSSMAGGGLTSTSASGYQLGGTVGQPGAGVLSGGSYALEGGFWSPGDALVVAVGDGRTALPVDFRVLQNAPNPFSGVTTIAFELPTERRVEMSVFNVRGERVRQLLDQVMPAGRHQLVWAGIADDGRPLPSGIYWVKTRAGERTQVQKTILLK
jgi:hypothetical protein